MKLLTFLVSIYLIVLAFVPCRDSMECRALEKHTSSTGIEHEHGHESEACTPFCSCACCAASVVYQPQVRIGTPEMITRVIDFCDETLSATCGIQTIWQPPKIA